MFDFEDIFGDNPEPKPTENKEEWELEPDILEATKNIIEAEANLIALEEEAKEKQEEANKLAAEETELLNRLQKIQTRRKRLDGDLFTYRNKKRREQEKISALESKKRVAKQNWERAKKNKELYGTLEQRALNYSWGKGLDNGMKILPHQLTGAIYLATYGRVVLGDEMGVGKTLTSIASLDLIGAKKVLIITPADIANNFVSEIRFWAPHRTVFSMRGLTKSERHTTIDVANTIGDYIAVINYEIWRKDKEFLKKLIESQFDAVIMDEAHTMKNMRSDAYKGAKELVHAKNTCPTCGNVLNWELSYANCAECGFNPDTYSEGSLIDDETNVDIRTSVKTVIPMTGSPILNSPEDLFTLLNLIDPYNFSDMYHFLSSYATMGFDGKWTFKEGGAQRLLKSLSGKFLARTTEDAGVVLPEQKPILHQIEIDPEAYPLQLRTIKQLSKHAAIMLDNGKSMSTMAAIALITRQRQANVWPGGIKLVNPNTGDIVLDVSEEVRESAKVDKAVELAKEFVANGERVAIFSQFKTGLAELEFRLKTEGIRAVRFDGDTPHNLREEVKLNFDKKRGETPKWDVILANYKTGGVGLNLTACTQTIIVDREWNPGKEEQAFKRTSRIGQDQVTHVHILELSKTIDEWHRDLIEHKRDLIEGFSTEQKTLQEVYLEALKKGEIL